MKYLAQIDQADVEAVAEAYFVRIQTLEAAARAVVEAIIIPDSWGRHEYDYCQECERTLTTGHGGDCPVGKLAALLEGT